MRDPSFLAALAAVIGVMGVPVLLPIAIAASRRGSRAGSWGLVGLLALLVTCITAMPALVFAIPFMLTLSVPIGIGLLARRATSDMQRELDRSSPRRGD